MDDIEFWEVVSHFPWKIQSYNTSTVWEASEPPPLCHHHDTFKVRLKGLSATWCSSGCPCSLQGPWTSKFLYNLNLSKILWCYFNSVQPSHPSSAPSPCTPTDPFCSIAGLLLAYWWREEKEQQMENRGAAPVPGSRKPMQHSPGCFLPTRGSLGFHHTVKVQNCFIVPKSLVRIQSHFFAQSKLMRGLPTKFTSSRTKSVQ